MLLITFFLFPAIYYYFSSCLIIDATSKGIINGSWLMFLLMFPNAFVVGRAWCGWICPAAGCQEAIARIRTRKVTRGTECILGRSAITFEQTSQEQAISWQ